MATAPHSKNLRLASVSKGLSCPSCHGLDIRRIDSIPPAREFAGRALDVPLPGGSLYSCGTCHLRFRSPRPTKQRLDELYKAGNLENWGSNAARRHDWTIAKRLIDSLPRVRTVLDVGCFDGRFLDYLGSRYRRAGIEVHAGAALAAEKRGVKIVGRDFNDLYQLRERYDCVTAIDVIEHVEDPRQLLAALAHATAPGGFIVVSTGNTDALPWRLMRGMYWYCSIPEHVSFISPRWCGQVSATLGLEVTHSETFSHEPLPLWSATAQAGANLLYLAVPAIAFHLRCAYAKAAGREPQASYVLPPPWRCARDHFLTIFKRNDSVKLPLL